MSLLKLTSSFRQFIMAEKQTELWKMRQLLFENRLYKKFRFGELVLFHSVSALCSLTGPSPFPTVLGRWCQWEMHVNNRVFIVSSLKLWMEFRTVLGAERVLCTLGNRLNMQHCLSYWQSTLRILH